MAVSKVKDVSFKNEWTGKHGTFFTFIYTMEDGTVLSANHTKHRSYQVGDEIGYLITKTDEYGNKGNVGKPDDEKYAVKGQQPQSASSAAQQTNNTTTSSQQTTTSNSYDKRDAVIRRQNAFNRAVDLLNNTGEFGEKFNLNDLRNLTIDIEKFYNELS